MKTNLTECLYIYDFVRFLVLRQIRIREILERILKHATVVYEVVMATVLGNADCYDTLNVGAEKNVRNCAYGLWIPAFSWGMSTQQNV